MIFNRHCTLEREKVWIRWNWLNLKQSNWGIATELHREDMSSSEMWLWVYLCICVCVGSLWCSLALFVMLRYTSPALYRQYCLVSLLTSSQTAKLLCFCLLSFHCCSLTQLHFPLLAVLSLFICIKAKLVYGETMLTAFV